MSIVRVQKKGQVTIPSGLRARIGIADGDFLEAEVDNGRIVLTPKSLIDRRLARSLADFEEGRTLGPFDNASDAMRALRSQSKTSP